MEDFVLGKFERDYSQVARAFQDTLESQPAGGAALAIFKDGREVVNIWGGESQEGVPWSEETSVLIYSCTKGLVSIMAHQLVERGLLDLEAPVANYWPEFAQAGKGDIPVRWLLEHKAGLSAPRKELIFEDIVKLEPILSALAEQKPIWEPGTGHAYHTLTFGYLIGRVISGATGQSLQDHFQEVAAQPLNIRAWIGVPEGVDS
jgi:CubicO group peptidase (beta-lactamase class C family)